MTGSDHYIHTWLLFQIFIIKRHKTEFHGWSCVGWPSGSLMIAPVLLNDQFGNCQEDHEELFVFFQDSPFDDDFKVDTKKLRNLIRRRAIYGDITQNASEKELKQLLKLHQNNVPEVILSLEEKVRKKGTLTVIPPAFYERDGSFYQPESFEIPIPKNRQREW